MCAPVPQEAHFPVLAGLLEAEENDDNHEGRLRAERQPLPAAAQEHVRAQHGVQGVLLKSLNGHSSAGSGVQAPGTSARPAQGQNAEVDEKEALGGAEGGTGGDKAGFLADPEG